MKHKYYVLVFSRVLYLVQVWVPPQGEPPVRLGDGRLPRLPVHAQQLITVAMAAVQILRLEVLGGGGGSQDEHQQLRVHPGLHSILSNLKMTGDYYWLLGRCFQHCTAATGVQSHLTAHSAVSIPSLL